jgi:hypothetical protein
MEHRDKPDRPLRELIRNYTIYVTIGVALVASVILSVECVPETYWGLEKLVGSVSHSQHL